MFNHLLIAQTDTTSILSTTILPDTLALGKSQSGSSYWTRGGFMTLTFSQVTLDKWAAGGQSSITINGFTGFFADYKRNRHTWENSLDLGYGVVRISNSSDEPESKFNKSDDKIILVSKYGYQITPTNDNWYLSGILDFKTQFAAGYAPEPTDSLISRFMAPGYLVVGLGIDYKPSETFSINYSPISGKFTFVNDQELSDQGAYGVDPGDRFRAELGSYFRIKFMDEIFTNVNIDSRLDLFANYLTDFGNIDVNWQNSLVMQINTVLTANLFTHLLYDDDIKIEDENGTGPRVQFKSIFGAGVAYTFGSTREEG